MSTSGILHGSRYPETSPQGGFDNFASLGIARSEDLKAWSGPVGRAEGIRGRLTDGGAIVPLISRAVMRG